MAGTHTGLFVRRRDVEYHIMAPAAKSVSVASLTDNNMLIARGSRGIMVVGRSGDASAFRVCRDFNSN